MYNNRHKNSEIPEPHVHSKYVSINMNSTHCFDFYWECRCTEDSWGEPHFSFSKYGTTRIQTTQCTTMKTIGVVARSSFVKVVVVGYGMQHCY